MSTIEAPPERLEEGLDRVVNIVIPMLREVPGFDGVLSLVDRTSGRSLTITLWDSEEALRTSEERADQLRSQAAEELGAMQPPQVDRYEVVVAEITAPAPTAR
ncbi:MAG TPA: antibiotic biosynthesis monooxygenase [Gaiellaceae bacterium]|nr:antibiotic biosynthesis monooxygenase [Gaiellaceae bacterium]